jgi:hypothetical protein
MGNAGNFCCAGNEIKSKVEACESLKELLFLVRQEIKRINDLLKQFEAKSAKKTLTIKMFSHSSSSFFYQTGEEMEKFYYYMKLDLVLVRLKDMIEEGTINKKEKKPRSSKELMLVDVNTPEKKKQTKRKYHVDIRDDEEEVETIRRTFRSQTSKGVIKIKRNIELDTCMGCLIEILKTETEFSMKGLEMIDRDLEKKVSKEV